MPQRISIFQGCVQGCWKDVEQFVIFPCKQRGHQPFGFLNIWRMLTLGNPKCWACYFVLYNEKFAVAARLNWFSFQNQLLNHPCKKDGLTRWSSSGKITLLGGRSPSAWQGSQVWINQCFHFSIAAFRSIHPHPSTIILVGCTTYWIYHESRGVESAHQGLPRHHWQSCGGSIGTASATIAFRALCVQGWVTKHVLSKCYITPGFRLVHLSDLIDRNRSITSIHKWHIAWSGSKDSNDHPRKPTSGPPMGLIKRLVITNAARDPNQNVC